MLSIIAMLCYGMNSFLYKVSAEKRCNTAWTTFSFTITVAILSFIFFIANGSLIEGLFVLILFSFLNAVTYMTTTIARIETLKILPASVAYPVIRQSTALVVLFSVIYFRDRLSLFQIIGVILAITVVWLLSGEGDRSGKRDVRKGFFLIVIALLFSAMTTVLQKFAAIRVELLAYIFISYCMQAVIAFSLKNRLQTEKENTDHKNAIVIGIIIGVLNFIGYFLVLKAYTTGPLAIVAPILSLSFAVGILLSIIVYKEEITARRVLGLVLSLVAVLLLRL